jgi:hypothetical protein
MMTETTLATVSTGSATTLSIREALPEELLNTVAVELELGNTIDWAQVPEKTPVSEYIDSRKEVAGSGSVPLSIEIDPEQAPAPLVDLINAVETGQLSVQAMSEHTLHASLDNHEVTTYKLSGLVDSNGHISFSRFCAYYETPWELRDEPVADFEGHDDQLVLSHREVVENAPESMYIPGTWGRPAHRSATTAANRSDGSFQQYLYTAVIEGHVTDGYWENEHPPYDFTTLLEDSDLSGELMYYAYRYNGWEFTVSELRAELEQLTAEYGSISL